MQLNKVKLGTLISLVTDSNINSEYDENSVRGISIDKKFIPTKADLSGVDLKKYTLVKPKQFAYVSVTSRNGEKISLAYNFSDEAYLVSSTYVVFNVISNKLLPEYLYIFFNRTSFDRYSRFNSWGSARETFSWEDMCDVEIELPDIEIQQKYVDIYMGLKQNINMLETSKNRIKFVCDAYIENLRKTTDIKEIGQYIFKGKKNTNENISDVLGIGQVGFIKPQKIPNESLKNYKVMTKGAICYAPPLYNIKADALHYYPFDSDTVCSPIYEVFYCNTNYLLPEYLILWLKREDFKRYAEFYALGVRNTFDYSLMEEFKIPIPSIEIQKDIVKVYNAYTIRNNILNIAINLQKNICPILIKGSVEEAKSMGNKYSD